MANRPIYFVPGLGATRTVFEKTVVTQGWEKHYIDWIDIKDEEEEFHHYIKRIAKQIKHKNPVFAGLSFGGIIAMELSKMYKSPFVIMISSFRDSSDLALSLRGLLSVKAYKLIPNIELNAIRKLIRKAYSKASNVSLEKLEEMMGSESPMFLRWSVKQIDEYTYDLPNAITINPIIGDSDRLVNIWRQSNVDVIKGGTHIAVYAHAKEVNKYIAKILKSNV